MLRRYIEKKERAFSYRDTNRKVLPFEIGEEWLPPDGDASGRQRLSAFVENALRDPDAFFALPKEPDYRVDADWLQFESPFPSRVEANDNVKVRLFLKPKADRVVLILPHWNSQPDSYYALARVLNFFNISAVRLALPYHDQRRPGFMERSDYMVSPNLARTIHATRQSVIDARSVILWLRQQGFERVGILGTSIGSCIGYLTFAHEPQIRVGVFNHVSNYFADVVWRGLSTRFVRRGLEEHIDLDELRYYWTPISPNRFVQRVKVNYRPHLLITTRYDTTFLPDLTEDLFAEYRRLEVPYERVDLPCGHYTMGMFPFSYYDGYLITRYFLKHL